MGNTVCTGNMKTNNHYSTISNIDIPIDIDTKDNTVDYRGYVIRAYIHEIQAQLMKNWSNLYYIMHNIPSVVNRIIESYYDKYCIFGVTLKQYKVEHLPDLEEIVFDLNNIFYSQNRLYIKDYDDALHAFVNKINYNHQSLLYETYPFRDFMHIKDIKYVKHSLFNDNRKIIQLG